MWQRANPHVDAPDTSQSRSAQALEAKCTGREGVPLAVEVAAGVLLLGNLSKSSVCYLQSHVKSVQGAFPLCCCHFAWCRAVRGHSQHLHHDGDHHPAGCSLAGQCRRHSTAACWCCYQQHSIHVSSCRSQSQALPALRRTVTQRGISLLQSLVWVYLWIRL